MRGGILKQYFLVISAVILISIFSLGAVLLLISSNRLVYNKKQVMTGEFTEILKYTNDVVVRKDKIQNIFDEYSNFERKYGGTIILTNSIGNIQGSLSNRESEKISMKIIGNLDFEPAYFYNDLDGYYSDDYHIVASKVMINNTDYYLFFIKPDINEWSNVKSIMGFFGISVFVAFIFIILIAYFVSSNTVKPLIEMSNVARKYSKGDFTARINIEENNEIGDLAKALNEMAISLENNETARKNFIANVSHELKTPMTSISGFVDGLLDGTIPQKDQNKYLSIVSAEAKRLSRLVVSMLNMEKFESGEIKPEFINVNINDVIFECLLSFEKKINQKNIEICGLDNETIMIYADKDLIYQVIYNLIENATKFVNQQGYIEFNLNKENGMFTFAIRNSGDGIKKEEIPLVFDKFYKSDKSRSLDKMGVGLGLYLATSIIHLHNGDISANSEEGMYTEFTFTIPVNKSFDKGKKN